MSSEVKRYWPEEIVGTGELVVYAQDYAALEAENAALKHRCGMLALGLENTKERQLQAEHQVAILRQHKTDYMEAADGTRKALEAECERLRMQLVACGVVALANTPESAAQARQMHPDYMSASCSDVANAVDREITLRQQSDKLAGLLREAKSAYTTAIHWTDMRQPWRRSTPPLPS